MLDFIKYFAQTLLTHIRNKKKQILLKFLNFIFFSLELLLYSSKFYC